MQPLLEQLGGSGTRNQSKVIHFPEGLPAFEKVTEFVVIANEEEAPFLWLQAVDNPNLSFICIDPFLVDADYRPDISQSDVEFLQIEDESDVFLLSIVNIRNTEDSSITANLIGPVCINWRLRIGKQVILNNHLKYSVRTHIGANGS